MSFPPGTEMFQFPGFASHAYGFSMRSSIAGGGCPIRRSSDQSLLAAPQGFSQRATSFIASWRQGIHQMPLLPSTQPAATTHKSPRRAGSSGTPTRGCTAPARRRHEQAQGCCRTRCPKQQLYTNYKCRLPGRRSTTRRRTREGAEAGLAAYPCQGRAPETEEYGCTSQLCQHCCATVGSPRTSARRIQGIRPARGERAQQYRHHHFTMPKNMATDAGHRRDWMPGRHPGITGGAVATAAKGSSHAPRPARAKDRPGWLRKAFGRPSTDQADKGGCSQGRENRAGAPVLAWWAWADLNGRPHAYQACALTS